MSKFIINNLVVFDPEMHTLYTLESKNLVSLHVTAANCFEMLISRRSDIVSKEEICDHVWRQNGLGSSNSSYYQTILHLRKKLEQAGLKANIIQTIPRKGITIPSSVIISETANETLENACQDTKIINRESPPKSENTLFSPREYSPALKKETRLIYCNLIFSCLIFLIIILFMGFNFLRKTGPAWSGYHLKQKDDLCCFYYSHVNSLDIDPTIGLAPSRDHCQNYLYGYMTKLNDIKRESIIICGARIRDNDKYADCVSGYRIMNR